MMNTSGKTYKQLSIPYFAEVFGILDDVLSQKHIPYYLVGVNAIALELLENGIAPGRGTKDIDFAIMISSFKAFEEISDELVQHGFTKVKAPWTFYHEKFKAVIDLLPFGEVEQHDTVNFNKRYSDLHVLGFKEVLEDAKEIYIEERVAHIPPLHGMVVLKLVAWSDRPEDRSNDPFDILLIIRKYFDLEFDEIVTHHFDVFPSGEIDRLRIAARVLGRKVAVVLMRSEKLRERIMSVLEKNTLDPSQSPMAKLWAAKNDWNLTYARDLLSELRRGIEEILEN